MMIKKTFDRILPVTALLFAISIFLIPAAPCRGCFSIVVGKEVSVDGYVIMAHNEDDQPPQIVNHHKIPRGKYSPGEKVKLLNGGQLEQVEQTWAYIWSEMPGMLFSDSYINEWGVSITSDNCPSREDKPKITNGGIGYMLRRLVAQRARTARQGVLIAGQLVERFGYIDSGRSYIICDPDEGWIFCVVNGNHWLAKRVPDNEVAMVANTYTIQQVDLSDSDNYLASKDITKYAVSRGWYNSKKDGPLDFAAAFANPKSASNPSNTHRQWSGLKYVASKPIPLGSRLPFSVVPKRKVGVADIMQILRHDKGSNLQSSLPITKPLEGGCPICSGNTQTSFVVQLRRNMPLDIGIVYWVCLASPGTSFYIPFHFGLSDFPRRFRSNSQRPTNEVYVGMISCSFLQTEPLQAFWTFSNFYNKVEKGPANVILKVKARARQIEKNAFIMQKPLEETALRLYTQDKTTAMQILANYSNGIYLSSTEAMYEVLGRK